MHSKRSATSRSTEPASRQSAGVVHCDSAWDTTLLIAGAVDNSKSSIACRAASAIRPRPACTVGLQFLQSAFGNWRSMLASETRFAVTVIAVEVLAAGLARSTGSPRGAVPHYFQRDRHALAARFPRDYSGVVDSRFAYIGAISLAPRAWHAHDSRRRESMHVEARCLGRRAGRLDRSRSISVVILQPQMRDQFLALQMPQRVLQLHQLNEQIMLGIQSRHRHRRLKVKA